MGICWSVGKAKGIGVGQTKVNMMFTPKCPNIVKDILKDHPTSSQNQPGPKSELQQSFKSGSSG